MALSDRQRHDAYEALTAAFAERTDLVIEMLRPATDLATTADVELVRRDLGAEIASLRKEMVHEFVAAHHEMAAMEARLELSFEQRIHDAFSTQTRTLMLGLVAAFLLTALTNVLTVILG